MKEAKPNAAVKITIHPYAEYFPLIEGKPFENLVKDIKENGQRESILIIRKPGEIVIIDGRNRYRACLAAGVKPRFDEWDGKGDLLALVMSLNLTRRHLSPLQRAAAAVPYKKHLAIEASKRMKESRCPRKNTLASKGKASDLAAEVAQVSASYIELCEKAFDSDPAIYAGILSDDISYAQARVKLAKKVRNRALPKASLPTDCKIIVGDCIREMDRMQAGSVKVIFADPPYNIGVKYDGDSTGDNLLPDEYLDWCEAWMKSAARLLSPDGSLFVLIDDTWSDLFGHRLRRLGLHRRNTIVWWNHFPQNTSSNFPKAAKFIHYYTKSPKKFIWHPDRIESVRQKISDKRACAAGKVPDNIWPIECIPGNAKDRVPFADAPPQLPDALPARCIIAASEPGDLILDPFNGNGTTGRAAVLAGRRYIGIDRSAKYAKQSEQWIQAALAAKGSK